MAGASPGDLARALAPRSLSEAAENLGRRPLGVTSLSKEKRREFARELAQRYPATAERIIALAEEACAHRFDILGSGPVDLGPTIDWNLDFKSGYRWPLGFFADLPLNASVPGADVKIPWELSRCQHFLRLGQAYWLTGDERYAREFSAQLNSWLEANPVLGSINWRNAMEPAIRIVNWLWAAWLFRDSPSFSSTDRARFLQSALDHGRFIAANLERIPGEASTNHYLANLVGLLYLGVLLPELRDSRSWREAALRGLAREMERQVHPDGVDFEASLGYHRLVTEIFLSAVALCRQNAVPVAETVPGRLLRMVEFTLWYTRPDGEAPRFGDADDGRLLPLTPAPPADHRHLLAVAGGLFDRQDFQSAAGELSPEAAWWFGLKEPAAAGAAALASRGFPEGGFYIMRHEGLHLIAHCGHPREVTGHAHNDALSFELSAFGRAWIVDSGTYCYGASEEWRNRFRATAAHNTVMVDSLELNRIEPGRLFHLGGEARPRASLWESAAEHDFLVAEHGAYRRLPGEVVHRRRFYFVKKPGYWLVEDEIEGSGTHRVQAFLHFAAGLEVERRGPGALTVRGEDGRGLHVSLESARPDIELDLREGWVSPGYGRKLPAPVAELDLRAELPLRWTWLLLPLADARQLILPELRSVPRR
jgi:hypothetical protein